MDLTAIFESWLMGDGNYPALHRHQHVRLSFELQARRLEPKADTTPLRLTHAGHARYAGRGRVLRRYGRAGEALAIIEASDLRFYVHGPDADKLALGARVEFEGTLLLDHYMWVEFLEGYRDPPNLFYNLRVTRIRKVEIPERFVRRGAKQALSYPTTVPPEDFGHVEDLETMEGQEFTLEFYVIDFSSDGLEGVEVPRTFHDVKAS